MATGPSSHPLVGLLADFPEDGELHVGSRVIAANITEADELRITIRLAEGSEGVISIRGSTLAQIIIDRNARALESEPEPSSATEIQVGDALDIPAPPPLKLVNADELLAASRRAKPQPPGTYKIPG